MCVCGPGENSWYANKHPMRADGHLDGVAAVHRESREDGYSENTFIQT